MSDKAGASIAPDISVTRPPKLVKTVVNHFRLVDQFWGFEGSEGPSQDTLNGFVRTICDTPLDHVRVQLATYDSNICILLHLSNVGL